MWKKYINFNSIIDMVVMKAAYKYRAYPSKEQKATLNRQMLLSKELYNQLLEKSKAYYKETGKTLTEYRMNVWITQTKKEKPEFTELHSQVLQNVSRKRKGSRNRKKAVIRFARYSEHIARIRQDCLHKLSYNLTHSYSLIAYEDLEIPNMMKNRRYAKSISESSWGNFTQMLQYKAESAGCVAVAVNPQYTTMTCSNCGNVQKVSISQRTFICEKCNMRKDRDINASINILKKALNSVSSNFDSKTVKATEGHSGSQACGDNVRPSARKAVAEEAGTIRVAA